MKKKFKRIAQGFTTLAEAEELLSIGIAPDTADCFWAIHEGNGVTKLRVKQVEPWEFRCLGYKSFPCWSTNALLRLLPQEIYYSDGCACNLKANLCIHHYCNGVESEDNPLKWWIGYFDCGEAMCAKEGVDIVSCLVRLLVRMDKWNYGIKIEEK